MELPDEEILGGLSRYRNYFQQSRGENRKRYILWDKTPHSTGEYNVWAQMIQRCHNPAYPKFKYYGARGITVHPRWRAYFSEFMKDMGRRPENHVLDRIDNERGYEPGNVRWATQEVSKANIRHVKAVVTNRDLVSLTVAGMTKTFNEWLDVLAWTGEKRRNARTLVFYKRRPPEAVLEEYLVKAGYKPPYFSS